MKKQPALRLRKSPQIKEQALYPATTHVFGDKTKHRDSKYMNNRLEQNHRGIKSRYRMMKGFKSFFCALIFCTVFEEIRQLFRTKNKTRAENRSTISSRIHEVNNLFCKSARASFDRTLETSNELYYFVL